MRDEKTLYFLSLPDRNKLQHPDKPWISKKEKKKNISMVVRMSSRQVDVDILKSIIASCASVGKMEDTYYHY